MHIINAKEQHSTAIRNIYAHHVLHGTGSFETDPPDAQEMLSRLRNVQSQGFPWYVALLGDTVIGYCYISRYRERHAYRFTVENSIYIDPAYQRQGVGKALLGHKVGDRVEVVPGKGDPFHIVIREIVKTTDESQDHIR